MGRLSSFTNADFSVNRLGVIPADTYQIEEYLVDARAVAALTETTLADQKSNLSNTRSWYIVNGALKNRIVTEFGCYCEAEVGTITLSLWNTNTEKEIIPIQTLYTDGTAGYKMFKLNKPMMLDGTIVIAAKPSTTTLIRSVNYTRTTTLFSTKDIIGADYVYGTSTSSNYYKIAPLFSFKGYNLVNLGEKYVVNANSVAMLSNTDFYANKRDLSNGRFWYNPNPEVYEKTIKGLELYCEAEIGTFETIRVNVQSGQTIETLNTFTTSGIEGLQTFTFTSPVSLGAFETIAIKPSTSTLIRYLVVTQGVSAKSLGGDCLAAVGVTNHYTTTLALFSFVVDQPT